jgi:hypothetical protein
MCLLSLFFFDFSISDLLKSLFFFLVLFCFSFLLVEEFEGGFTALARPNARLAGTTSSFGLLEGDVVPLVTTVSP